VHARNAGQGHPHKTRRNKSHRRKQKTSEGLIVLNKEKSSKTPAGDESRIEELARETVLDFLWGGEAPEGAGPRAQNQQGQAEKPRIKRPSAAQPQAAARETSAGDELQGALARYSAWLDAWQKPA
jgi:hypothetical protein